MGYKIGSKLVLTLFIIFLSINFLTLAFSFYVYTSPDYPVEEYYTESGTHVIIHHDMTLSTINLYLCTPLNFVLTIVCYFGWRRKKRYDKLIDDLPSYIKMYRRANLEKVAQRMNISVKELDYLLQTCVKKGTVKGYFDYAVGEFVSEGSHQQEIQSNMKCPNCGATIETRFLEGEEMKCGYCNIIIVQRQKPSK